MGPGLLRGKYSFWVKLVKDGDTYDEGQPLPLYDGSVLSILMQCHIRLCISLSARRDARILLILLVVDHSPRRTAKYLFA